VPGDPQQEVDAATRILREAATKTDQARPRRSAKFPIAFRIAASDRAEAFAGLRIGSIPMGAVRGSQTKRFQDIFCS
jgi:hypothetical protein